jgi:predicted metalloprotease with PDZ domain
VRIRTAAVGALCLTAALPAVAQTLRTSAPISNVRYEVIADSAAVGRRQLGVVMSFQVAGTSPVVLAMSSWSPGHYVLDRFARRVSKFNASASGQPLAWRKLDFQTWQIQPRASGTVTVSFDYLADAVDRAIAWTAPNFAFFNGTNLFLYPVGRGFDWPAQVFVRTQPEWRVATGMDPAGGGNNFRASNYHDLVDMPFYVGRFALDSTLIVNKWIRLAWYPASSLTPERRDRTFSWLSKFVPVQVAIFGEAPFRNYTLFQRSDTVVNGGGLEHQSSQVDEVLTSRLDAPTNAGLYSHEFFHAWNVKRLRPADLVPYRYDDAQQTTWLWVSEGITDYYSAIALVRGGVSDSTEFFATIAKEITTVATAPPTALSDASLNAWIGLLDGSAGLYYDKGGLAGFLLDIMIRDASDNRSSLDLVMRRLYNTTYKRGRGFTPADWWSEVSRAAQGKNFAEFARRYIDGRDPFPIDSVFALAGLRAEADTVREARLGLSTVADSAGLRVSSLSAGGPASVAGVRVGDRIESIGEIPITNDASLDTFRSRYAGTVLPTLPITLKRGTETISLQVPVRLFPRILTRVVVQPDASAKAARIRAGILHGTLQ